MSPYLFASIIVIAFLLIGALVLAFLGVTFVGSAVRQTVLRIRSGSRDTRRRARRRA